MVNVRCTFCWVQVLIRKTTIGIRTSKHCYKVHVFYTNAFFTVLTWHMKVATFKNSVHVYDQIKVYCTRAELYSYVFIERILYSSFCIHTKRNSYSLCSQRERNSISVQSYLQIHRWCIVHKQPRIRRLYWQYVFCWHWEQGHHREHPSASFLDLLQSIGRDGQTWAFPSPWEFCYTM